MATARRVSIKTPDQLDLRAIQQAIDNIRERITGAESLADTLASAAGAKVANDIGALETLRRQVVSLNSQINALQQALNAIQINDLDYLAISTQARVHELAKQVDEPRIDIDYSARAMIQALELRIQSLEQGRTP